MPRKKAPVKEIKTGEYTYSRIAIDFNFSQCSEVEERKLLAQVLLSHKGSGIAYETCGKFITRALTEEPKIPYEVQTVLLQRKIYKYILMEYDFRSVDDFISYFEDKRISGGSDYLECDAGGRRCITFRSDDETESKIGLMLKETPNSDRTAAVLTGIRNYLVTTDDETYLRLSSEKLLQGLADYYENAIDDDDMLQNVVEAIQTILVIGGGFGLSEKQSAEEQEYHRINNELKSLFG